MKPPEEPGPVRKAPKPEPLSVEDVRRMIEEYANGLRDVIKKLRQRLV